MENKFSPFRRDEIVELLTKLRQFNDIKSILQDNMSKRGFLSAEEMVEGLKKDIKTFILKIIKCYFNKDDSLGQMYYEVLYEIAPKNTDEVINAINRIPDLEKQINAIMHPEELTSVEDDMFGEQSPIQSQIMWTSGLGSCYTYWDVKKRLLKEKYGIIWYTPSECTPYMKYD